MFDPLPLDLDALRATAEAATEGPWTTPNGWERAVVSTSVPPDAPMVADTDSDESAAHIATFDPPTIAALLDRLEAAEQRAEEGRRARLAMAYLMNRDPVALRVVLEASGDADVQLAAIEADLFAAADPPTPEPPTGAHNFWLSWYSPAKRDTFELHSPWWVSGYDADDRDILIAAVRAESEDAAWGQVRRAYDDDPGDLPRRISQEVPADWSPFCGRWPRAEWMAWDEARTCACPKHAAPPATEERKQ